MSEQESIIGMALEAGFMLSTAHGQGEHKLMPVSDSATLRKFAELVTAAAQRERDEAKGLLSKLVKEADEGNPFCSVGHFVEHVIPDARKLAGHPKAAKGDTP